MISDRHTEIATRAYTMWELEGRPTGKEIEHWLRAEAEFETKQHAQTEAAPKPRRPMTKRGRRTPHSNADG
jgi:hypothetical protein